MFKKTAIIITISLITISNILGETKAKYNSQDIYEMCLKIEERAKDKVWPGFDIRNYARLKSEKDTNYIYFSNDPDNKKNRIFSWRLFDKYFREHSLEENLSITFHEAFHAFQRDKKRKGGKWGAENAMLIFEYQETSARNNALFSIEAKILRDALKSKGKRVLRQKVREFLAVRHLRQGEFDERFAKFEKGAELNEGLAEYAGTKAVLVGMKSAGQIKINFAEKKAEDFLAKKYAKLDSITGIGRNVRLKFYYTGSAQGFLLERLLPDWKMQIQLEGKSLQELLSESAGKLSDREKLERVLSRYEYEKILVAQTKAVAQRKAENQALLEKTLDQKGRHFLIDYSALTKWAGIQNFDPMNVTMVSPKVRVHTRSVKFGSKNNFTAKFSQAVVENLKDKTYTTVVPENQIQGILVDGRSLDLNKPTETVFRKNIEIKTENFAFEGVAGKIRITAEKIAIILFDL